MQKLTVTATGLRQSHKENERQRSDNGEMFSKINALNNLPIGLGKNLMDSNSHPYIHRGRDGAFLIQDANVALRKHVDTLTTT